jgi:hypothetical protein
VQRYFAWLLGILLVSMLSGCSQNGPELATVTGTVTLDGKPLEHAIVTFQPASGRPSFGTTDEQGKYAMGYSLDHSGVVAGRNRVFIRTQTENDEGRVVRKEVIPAKYNDKSELVADVELKANVIDFALTSQ